MTFRVSHFGKQAKKTNLPQETAATGKQNKIEKPSYCLSLLYQISKLPESFHHETHLENNSSKLGTIHTPWEMQIWSLLYLH